MGPLSDRVRVIRREHDTGLHDLVLALPPTFDVLPFRRPDARGSLLILRPALARGGDTDVLREDQQPMAAPPLVGGDEAARLLDARCHVQPPEAPSTGVILPVTVAGHGPSHALQTGRRFPWGPRRPPAAASMAC